MQIELWPIDRVKPYPNNPRINDDAVAAVAGSLKEFGWRQSTVVDPDGVIIVGYTRVKAAALLGYTEVPVHVATGVFDLKTKLLAGGKFEAKNDESLTIEKARTGWLYTSQANGLTRCELPLLGKDDAPAEYRVTLYFAELQKDAKPGDRVFYVKLQGEKVAAGLDVVQASGRPERALTREFRHVKVTSNLMVELDPIKGQPILSVIEVERE